MTIQLQPLDATQRSELVGAAAAEGMLQHEVVAAITDRAGGNPLFLQELVDLVTRTGGRGVCRRASRRVVATRIDRLPAGDRALLR